MKEIARARWIRRSKVKPRTEQSRRIAKGPSPKAVDVHDFNDSDTGFAAVDLYG